MDLEAFFAKLDSKRKPVFYKGVHLTRWLEEPHVFVPETSSDTPESHGANRHCELCWKTKRHKYHIEGPDAGA